MVLQGLILAHCGAAHWLKNEAAVEAAARLCLHPLECRKRGGDGPEHPLSSSVTALWTLFSGQVGALYKGSREALWAGRAQGGFWLQYHDQPRVMCGPSHSLPPLFHWTPMCVPFFNPLPHVLPWSPSQYHLHVHTLRSHTQTPPFTPAAAPLPWTHTSLCPTGPGCLATGAVSSTIPPLCALLAVTPEGLVSEPKSQVAEAGEVLGPEQCDG